MDKSSRVMVRELPVAINHVHWSNAWGNQRLLKQHLHLHTTILCLFVNPLYTGFFCWTKFAVDSKTSRICGWNNHSQTSFTVHVTTQSVYAQILKPTEETLKLFNASVYQVFLNALQHTAGNRFKKNEVLSSHRLTILRAAWDCCLGSRSIRFCFHTCTYT